jgi:hypothetical protein
MCVRKCDADSRCKGAVFVTGESTVNETDINCILKARKCDPVTKVKGHVTFVKEENIPCAVYKDQPKMPLLKSHPVEEPEGF